MKLLFDQNLSPRLAVLLVGHFPESAHVSQLGLDRVSDSQLWKFARDNNYCIVSKDSDFSDWALLYGHPPGFVWIRVGNCTTSKIATSLLENKDLISKIGAENNPWVLVIL